MTTIITSDASTDRAIIDLITGYVVEVDDTEMLVAGSGRTQDGFITIDGYEWDDDRGEGDRERPVSVRFDQATIFIY